MIISIKMKTDVDDAGGTITGLSVKRVTLAYIKNISETNNRPHGITVAHN